MNRTIRPAGIILIFLALSLIAFRDILFSSGVPSSYAEWVFPQFSDQVLDWMTWESYVWRPPDLGTYTSGATTAYYAHHLIISPLAWLGLGGDVISKILLVISMTVAGSSMFYLCQCMRIGMVGSTLGGFFYMLTPALFDRFVQGHLIIALEYALLPLALALFISYLEERRNFKYLLITGIIVALTNITMVGMCILWSMLILYSIFFVVNNHSRDSLFHTLRSMLAIFGIFLVVHSFWIIPLAYRTIQTPLDQPISSYFGEWPISSIVSVSSYQVPDYTVRLMGFHVGYFWQVVDDNTWWQYISFIPAVIAFSALLIKPKDLRVLFFCMLALLGILLTSASNLMGEERFLSLLESFPFLRIFRDPSRWIYLTCIGYAVLIAITAGVLQNLISRFFTFRHSSPSRLLPKLTSFTLVLVLVGGTIFVYGKPFLSGDLSGLLEPLDYGKNNEELYHRLSEEPEDFRVFLLPNPSPIQYPEVESTTRDMMSVYPGKPPLGYMSAYQPAIVPFLFNTSYSERTEYLGKLLGLANIKYVVFDPEKRTSATDNRWATEVFPDMRFTNEKVSKTIETQRDLELSETLGSIQLWQNTSYLPHLFPAHNLGLYAGDLDGLVSLSYLEEFDLDDAPLVFLSQLSPTECHDLSKLPNQLIIIQEGHLLDLVLAVTPEEYLFNTVPYFVDTSPDRGWAPLRWFWHRWHYQSTVEHAVFTFAPSRLNIPYTADDSGYHEIYIKAFMGPQASAIKVYSDEIEFGEITTVSAGEAGFQWIHAGTIYLESGKHDISLFSGNGENAMSNIAIIPQEVLSKASAKVTETIQDKQVIILSELNNIQSGNRLDTWSKNYSELYDLSNKQILRYPYGESYSTDMQDDSFALNLTFNHPGDEGESLGLFLTPSEPIDLKQSPLYEIVCKVDDPYIQDIVIYASLDTNGDGLEDETYRFYSDKQNYELFRSQLDTGYGRFEFDLLEAVERLFPDKDDYIIIDTWITFRKYPGVDTSNELSGDYNFHLKHVALGHYDSWWISNSLSTNASQGTSLTNSLSSANALTYILQSPKAGFYDFALRATGDGIDSESNLHVDIDDTSYKIAMPPLSEGFRWLNVGPVYLPAEEFDITFRTEGDAIVYLDELFLIESNDSPSNTLTKLTHERINPTQYSIQGTTSEPFYLFFSEKYHHSWQACIENGPKISPYPGFSFGNLFYINETGDFKIDLVFSEQRIYSNSLKFSFVIFGLLILCLVIPNRFYRVVQQYAQSTVSRLLVFRKNSSP